MGLSISTRLGLLPKDFIKDMGLISKKSFHHKPITIRVILTIDVTHHWTIQQIDINNAFLNGLLDEEVYMEQPQGFFSSDPSLVCKLHKALYGFKQTPMQWYERLHATLIQLHFKANNCDPSLFTYFYNGHTFYLLVYVDDIIITGSSKSLVQDIITKLNLAFSLKHLGDLDYFSGIKVN